MSSSRGEQTANLAVFSSIVESLFLSNSNCSSPESHKQTCQAVGESKLQTSLSSRALSSHCLCPTETPAVLKATNRYVKAQTPAVLKATNRYVRAVGESTLQTLLSSRALSSHCFCPKETPAVLKATNRYVKAVRGEQTANLAVFSSIVESLFLSNRNSSSPESHKQICQSSRGEQTANLTVFSSIVESLFLSNRNSSSPESYKQIRQSSRGEQTANLAVFTNIVESLFMSNRKSSSPESHKQTCQAVGESKLQTSLSSRALSSHCFCPTATAAVLKATNRHVKQYGRALCKPRCLLEHCRVTVYVQQQLQQS
ncbi:hypothetical protein J6590_068697 [Homalodisca vitripennis]|nr:hypothetical protein J6590_068697 [Homalodisca vitripennis]